MAEREQKATLDEVLVHVDGLVSRMEAIRKEAEDDRARIREDLTIDAKTKVSGFEKAVGLAATLILIVSIGAVLLVVGGNLAEAERASCQRVIQDRLTTIEVREVQAKAARAIAADSFQSAKTRSVRRVEAEALQVAINDLRTRVDPKNGGRLDCAKAFPPPGLFG